MKKIIVQSYNSPSAHRCLKIFTVLVLIFFVSGYLVPPAYSITVEEEAGKREKKKLRPYSDEFTRKAPERRDGRRTRQEKDPRLACLLSLVIPGGGHIYLREDLKGIGFCLLTVGFYSAAAYYAYIAWSGDSSGTEEKSKYIISGVLFFVGIIFHVVGIVEAYNDAIEINETKYYYGKKKSKSPYVASLIYEITP
jgi:hypothetical protein